MLHCFNFEIHSEFVIVFVRNDSGLWLMNALLELHWIVIKYFAKISRHTNTNYWTAPWAIPFEKLSFIKNLSSFVSLEFLLVQFISFLSFSFFFFLVFAVFPGNEIIYISVARVLDLKHSSLSWGFFFSSLVRRHFQTQATQYIYFVHFTWIIWCSRYRHKYSRCSLDSMKSQIINYISSFILHTFHYMVCPALRVYVCVFGIFGWVKWMKWGDMMWTI